MAHRKPPDPMTVPVSEKRTALLAAARERILVLDGAMGTMIQGLEYDEAAFRGERFADFHRDLRGNNDLLILTQPKAIEAIHADYLRAGADIVATNTFSSTSIRSKEHTSELQSLRHLVCRLLLEKKKNKNSIILIINKKKHQQHKNKYK